MIVPRSPQLLKMVRYVGKPLLTLVAWDFVIVVCFKVLHWNWVGSPHVPLALYGSAIGVIIGFRNNSAYGRWWEARALWGSVVNNSRSWARQIVATLRPHSSSNPAELTELHTIQQRLVYYQIAYAHCLRTHLRKQPLPDEVHSLLTVEEIAQLDGQSNVPATIQTMQGTLLRTCLDRGWLDSMLFHSINQSLDDLADAQGGNERIKNTPMPKQYDYFPRLFVQIYCLVLPMGLIENLGWFTPIGSTVVGFMFLALDKIGRDLEDPFENTIFDVPLCSITKTIEINLRQMLGEKTLPAPEKPIRGVLW